MLFNIISVTPPQTSKVLLKENKKLFMILLLFSCVVETKKIIEYVILGNLFFMT